MEAATGYPVVHNCKGVHTGLWMGKGKGPQVIHRPEIHFYIPCMSIFG